MSILLSSGYLREDQDTNGFTLLQKPYRTRDGIEILRSLLSDPREETTLE
jgi:putative ubiquitin-RnfH superfamily antitoxin RatB of RatAB toxin-antitoxin module